MIKGEQSRGQLENLLLSFFEEVTYNSNIYNNIKNELFENHNIARSKIDGIFTQTTPINSILDEELYLINKQIYEKLKDENREIKELNPENFFLPKEIFEYNTFKHSKQANISNIIEFKNVIQVNPEQWYCVMSVKEVADLFNRGVISYDPQTQRQLTKKVTRGRVTKKPTIIPEKIKAIEAGIEAGELNDYSITVNIPVTGEERFEYRNNNIRVEVNGISSKCSCIDGYHRFLASANYGNTHPESNFNVVFKIYHATTFQAARYVSSVDQQTKIDDLHVQVISDTNAYITMVKDINNYGSKETNGLYNKIGEDLFDVKNNNKYTTYKILADAIEHNFGKDNKLSLLERKKIQKFIIDGFIYIIGTFESDFKNPNTSRIHSIVTEPNTFIGYISMLSKLYKEKDWEEKLTEVLNEIDFDKEKLKDKWQEIGLFTSKIGSTHVRKISQYFKQFIKGE